MMMSAPCSSSLLLFSLVVATRIGLCACQEECVVIDFETSGNGTDLNRGDYVKNEWSDRYGMRITAVGNDGDFALLGGVARIFDTSNPGIGDDGDEDLGTPNQGCGGPGVGAGGAPGRQGENCVALGNVLIIQESDKETPDDNARGGTMLFGFEVPVLLRRVGLLDMDDNETPMLLTTGETSFLVDVVGLGNNAVQNVTFNKDGVLSLVVTLNGSGAITFLEFCIPSVQKVTEIVQSDSNTNYLHKEIREGIDVTIANPGVSWADSYSVGDRCFCNSTFDHGIGNLMVETSPGQELTVEQACALLGPGPGVTDETALYNDIQCGNGPPNDTGDEDVCPGRVDIGPEGCGQIGPVWKFDDGNEATPNIFEHSQQADSPATTSSAQRNGPAEEDMRSSRPVRPDRDEIVRKRIFERNRPLRRRRGDIDRLWNP